MKRPRIPGAGIAGAVDVKLGSSDIEFLAVGTSQDQDRRCAAALDRLADLHLSIGRTRLAEYLSRRAEMMRAGGAR